MTFPQECCPVCVCPGWKGLPLCLKTGAFGRLRHGWIRSDSFPVPGWVRNPYCRVIFDMHPAWFCLKGARQGGGRGMAVRGHPTEPFSGWIRCHIKNHSWLEGFFFSEQGNVGQRNRKTKVVNVIGSQCKVLKTLPTWRKKTNYIIFYIYFL